MIATWVSPAGFSGICGVAGSDCGLQAPSPENADLTFPLDNSSMRTLYRGDQQGQKLMCWAQGSYFWAVNSSFQDVIYKGAHALSRTQYVSVLIAMQTEAAEMTQDEKTHSRACPGRESCSHWGYAIYLYRQGAREVCGAQAGFPHYAYSDGTL